MADSRLSLLAQFDDLMRNQNILAQGIEGEFLKFVWNQETCRQRWLESVKSSQGLKDRIKVLDAENSRLRLELRHARGQIDHEMRVKRKAEQERDALERQVVTVRELLNSKSNQSMLNDKDREKLAFLSTDFQSHYESPGRPGRNGGLSPIDESKSMLSPSDISYDPTEEDLDEISYYLRSGQRFKKRPSAPPMEDEEEEESPSGKRQKCVSPQSHERKRKSKKHRRSKSAVIPSVQSPTVEVQVEITAGGHKRMSKFPSMGDIKAADSEDDIRPRPLGSRHAKTPSSSSLHNYGSTNSLNRLHNFVTKTVIRPEQCVWCGKKIKFSKPAMKCRDCKATAHPECKEQVPLPCVPVIVTPGNTKGTLMEYAPPDPPMIPALVIHCANEIEHRGLTEKGIYRVPGSEREVKELKDKFLRGRGGPNLSNVMDINVVCGCLKDFLRGLKEPLVTLEFWHDFVAAAEMRDRDESLSGTYQAISMLPRANRDTIAFLIRHLQRVSESEYCEMGVNNLASVFGPTIVGYSSPDPEPAQVFAETKKQQMVVERLITISSDYWENFLNIDDEAVHTREGMTPQTPERRPGFFQQIDLAPYSILGSLSNTGDHQTDRAGSWRTPKLLKI